MNCACRLMGCFLLLLLCLAPAAWPAEPAVDLQPLDCTREPWVWTVEAKVPSSEER